MDRQKSKKVQLVIRLAMIHFVVSFGLFLHTFGETMKRFDNGEPAGFLEQQANILSEILFFPLVHLARLAPISWFQGFSGYIPFIINSILWATILYQGYQWIKRRRQNKT
jgi:hypothetical protein